MNNGQKQFHRLLRVLLPIVILSGIMIGSFSVSRAQIGAQTAHNYVKATVTAILQDDADGLPFNGSQLVRARLTSGTWKGEEVELSNSNSYQRGAFCQEGTKIIALVQQGSDGIISGSVYNYDRTGMLWGLLALFLISLLAVGGWKGAATIYALAFTFACVIFLYLPLLYAGWNGIAASALTAVVVLAASIYILNGWSRKSVCSILGTTAGVCISGGLALLFGSIGHLNGFHMSEVESMIYIANASKLRVGDLLYAGVLVSGLGAVMDVSVSMAAAMEEVHAKAPQLSPWELFRSGMTVGHDMIGTMSNTLILAYTGSATGALLTIYSYEMPFLQVTGYNSIMIELLYGLCGTIGVILTVPIQAGITAFALRHAKKEFVC